MSYGVVLSSTPQAGFVPLGVLQNKRGTNPDELLDQLHLSWVIKLSIAGFNWARNFR